MKNQRISKAILFTLITIAFFSSCKLYAQSYPEDIMYRFAYDYSFRNYVGGKKSTELKFLDISKSYTKFESANQVLKDELRDSLLLKGASNEEILRASSRFPLVREYSTIVKNHLKKGELTVLDFAIRLYTYTEHVEKIGWQTVPGDTVICDFECKKAKCLFRGRDWTVWYCKDIPINEGPWKLSGLPGMILCAYDSGDNYVFTCVGIEEPTNKKIRIMDPNKYVKCTRQELMKAKRRLIEDPDGFEKSMGIISTNADGTPIKYKSHKAILLENE